MAKLTAKQERFVEEYLVDKNAAASAERAGYSAKTARSIGAENLTKPAILAAILAALAAQAKNSDLNARSVIEELKAIAFSDIGDVVDFTADGFRVKPGLAIPAAARRAIASVKVRRQVHENEAPVEVIEFKLWDKVDALRQLMEYLTLMQHVQALFERIRSVEDAQNGQCDDPRGAAQDASDRGSTKPTRRP